MTRKECLEQAMGCVLHDRNNEYGKPEDCFGMIARMWGAYLGVCVSAPDVAAMMALLKIARAKANPKHGDNWVDLAGYAACGAECANVELYPWQKEVMGTAAPEPEHKAEGCEALVEKDAPQTKEELFNRIVDCNPSTFGCVHKPTGEELAEMAEEEGDA